jgi:hypothetical protein
MVENRMLKIFEEEAGEKNITRSFVIVSEHF